VIVNATAWGEGDLSPSKEETEVTEEMYDAGSEALGPFYMGDGVYDLRRPCLTAVYRAMREVERKAGQLSD
jgi:hypothetical protein